MKALYAALGVVMLAAVGFVIWYVVFRDTWEIENLARLSAELNQADQIRQSDPLRAYKTYDAVLNEAKQHRVTIQGFSAKLAAAEQSQATLRPIIESQLKAEEAERQRQADEEARLAAAEKQRIADIGRRKRAEDEARQIAEEKRLSEAKRRKEAASVYRDAPQSARDALNVLKKIEARTEIGLNYAGYSTIVGEAWAEVKIFSQSEEGQKLPEFSMLLTKTIGDYKLALDIWNKKIQYSSLYGDRSDVEAILQACWVSAGMWIELAESLLNGGDVEKSLEAIEDATEKAVDVHAEWEKIENKILNK